MKRPEMLEIIRQELLKTVGGDAAKHLAEDILSLIEKAGMRPPCLPDKYCQALFDVYIYPNLNQWEEEVVKDQKVMERVKLRGEWRNKP